MLPLLFKGALIGFAIAAPVGPIGVLCIRRTLAHGRLSGLLSGLGAATADGCYGAVAAFGLAAVSNFLTGHQNGLRGLGGLFLLYLGLKIFRSQPAEVASEEQRATLLGDYASTFFLTLTNPMTVFSFAAIFAGTGLGNPGNDFVTATAMVAGVVLGSALWWILLSAGVSLFRRTLTPQSMRFVNWISGALVAGFGAVALGGIMAS